MQCGWVWMPGKLQLTHPSVLESINLGSVKFCLFVCLLGSKFCVHHHCSFNAFCFQGFCHLNFKKLSEMLTLNFLLNGWVFFLGNYSLTGLDHFTRKYELL